NQTCIRECPFRAHHLNTSSLCSQPGGNRLWFEFPLLECGLEVVRDPETALEEGNRNFPLIRGLVRMGARVEILTNQTCIRECPFRAHHLNTSSLCSQPGGNRLWFEFPLLECGLEVVRDPEKLISSIWVRPEDLAVYEEAGVHRFKIGRAHV
ncbi:MAG: hypothetical protein M1126_00610, partial [Candidatus Thermoplasmatota archaeon]|nr:hypothetical protein [Candidatus Thermoplasmatota archaeon]